MLTVFFSNRLIWQSFHCVDESKLEINIRSLKIHVPGTFRVSILDNLAHLRDNIKFVSNAISREDFIRSHTKKLSYMLFIGSPAIFITMASDSKYKYTKQVMIYHAWKLWSFFFLSTTSAAQPPNKPRFSCAHILSLWQKIINDYLLQNLKLLSHNYTVKLSIPTLTNFPSCYKQCASPWE